MKKLLFTMMALAMTVTASQAKTLVVFYSFTNNCRTIANDLKGQLADADLVEVLPAEEGLDYAANNYAIGSALISAIRSNPNDASSYPAIKDVKVDFSQYDDVVVATPLWWSNMAAPMQSFLFQNGKNMAGKKIGLIVSSASSGVSGVEADAKRLIPNGNFSKSLWIRSSQVSNCHSMIASWISETGIGTPTGISVVENEEKPTIFIEGSHLMVNGDFERVEIFDAIGRKQASSTGKATEISTLDASNVYVAIVRGGKGKTSYKFMVK